MVLVLNQNSSRKFCSFRQQLKLRSKMDSFPKVLLTLLSLLTPNTDFDIASLLELNYPQRISQQYREFTGPLAAKNSMSQAVKLHFGKLAGPESVAEYNGQLYTGTAGGWIYRVNDSVVTPVTQIQKGKCREKHFSKTGCGRPLGLRFDSKGIVYIVDGAFGLYSYNFETNNLSLLLSNEQTASFGVPSVFLDDFDLVEGAEGHTFYISDVSSRYRFHQCSASIFAPDYGRLISFEEKTGEVKALVNDLWFPNGVQVTDDQTAVLVNEFSRQRIVKYYISGPKEGQTEVFLDNLPGMPDNIRRSKSEAETYWVALAMSRNGTQDAVFDQLQKKPFVAKLLLAGLHYIGRLLQLLGEIADIESIEALGFKLSNLIIVLEDLSTSSYGLFLEVDKDGNIINSVHAPEGEVTGISEIHEVTKPEDGMRTLYVGSYMNPYLAKVEIEK